MRQRGLGWSPSIAKVAFPSRLMMGHFRFPVNPPGATSRPLPFPGFPGSRGRPTGIVSPSFTRKSGSKTSWSTAPARTTPTAVAGREIPLYPRLFECLNRSGLALQHGEGAVLDQCSVHLRVGGHHNVIQLQLIELFGDVPAEVAVAEDYRDEIADNRATALPFLPTRVFYLAHHGLEPQKRRRMVPPVKPLSLWVSIESYI